MIDAEYLGLPRAKEVGAAQNQIFEDLMDSSFSVSWAFQICEE